MTEERKREQIAFTYQGEETSHRNVQRLPHRTRAEIEAEARRQAAQEASNPHYGGHYAGTHPEDQPFLSQDLTYSSRGRKAAASRAPVTNSADGDDELEEDDS